MNTQLDTFLERYEVLLSQLSDANSTIDVEQVLGVLNARDAVQKALKEQKCIPNSKLQKIINLDDRLRLKAERITRTINSKTTNKLKYWRESVQPSADAWWWKLDVIASQPGELWEWLWTSLSIAGWTANITLLVNIATRFLGGRGGVDLLGAAAVTLPSILALLQAENQLTKTGLEGFGKLLDKTIPRQYHQKIKLFVTLMMSGLLFIFWLLLPSISDRYNLCGLKNYYEKKLSSAEQDYLRAISLNSNNVEAHYNLGLLYEDWLNLQKAKNEYQIAVAGDLLEAYNNLARLYIQEKKYHQAASLLTKGLDLAAKKNSNPEIRYSLFKNLGWVRLEQGRYEQAQQTLQAAIGITKNPEAAGYIENPGAAHCLLAQVLEKQKQSTAIEQWHKCAELGSRLNPDEEDWLYKAQERIQKEGK